MTRLVQWLRLLWWSFVTRQALVVEVARLRQQVDDDRAEREKEAAALTALHDQGMALQRRHIAELRTECLRWEEALADSERQRLVEVRRGTEAWQEAGIQRRRADRLQSEWDQVRAELDRLAGAGVEHAAARD